MKMIVPMSVRRFFKIKSRSNAITNRNGEVVKQSKKKMARKSKYLALVRQNDNQEYNNCAGFATLPDFLQLEILSFVYDEVSKFLISSPHQYDCRGLQRHISLCITEEKKNLMTCRICHAPATFPYRLKDCGHVTCGRCLWMHRCVKFAPCRCGMDITNRPEQLDPTLSNCQAYWLLTPEGVCVCVCVCVMHYAVDSSF